ncbi:hypothetical protein CV102_18270 [Natronococcus pandeyae]|uniref:HNH nuclease domain-containing protein n=1 Tax=Natronococcus pandeyae TaxID=2055836 RepID=A0A8J8TPB7_9EURY|nr:hypothetical protein CV102_18270 [Natronococcus pandeyae]
MGNIIVEILVRGLYNLFGLDSPYSATGYGPNWTKQRRKCLERDDYQCRICGKTETEIGRRPAVHHITPRREFAASEWHQMNALSNLVALCPSCHGTVEGKYQDTSPEEFVAKSRQNF